MDRTFGVWGLEGEKGQTVDLTPSTVEAIAESFGEWVIGGVKKKKRGRRWGWVEAVEKKKKRGR